MAPDYHGLGHGAAGPLEPGLKHQDGPEVVVPIASTGEVVLPHRTDRLDVEITFAAEAIFGKQRLGPFSESLAQPVDAGRALREQPLSVGFELEVLVEFGVLQEHVEGADRGTEEADPAVEDLTIH